MLFFVRLKKIFKIASLYSAFRFDNNYFFNMVPRLKHNTKIVATVGPASHSYESLLALAQSGVHIFRLNFSHGTHDGHKSVIESIQKLNREYDFHLGILADLQGPKLRIGKMENEEMNIKPGDVLTFTNEKCVGNLEKIYMSYEQFAEDVEPGEKVLVDDGKIVLEVLETNKKDNVKLKVLFGSVISSNKGVNLPDTKVSLPCLTEKDLADLDFILTQPVNWIALSFVRSADDIIDLRKRVEARHHEAKILAKIEKPEAVRRIKKIIKASNAIMISRGDLAVELPMEKLPGIQKEIINLCMQWARPVIVATQMMESMIHNTSPTRAEITDVANAILDGADALMLSAETAVGDHPPKVIEAMNKIIIEAEKTFSVKGRRPTPNSKSRTFLSDVICFNAAKTAVDVGAQAILGLTISGYTAFKISSYRPDCKIYIFSERSLMLGTMNLLWGVQCFEYKKYTTTDETFEDITNILKTQNLLKHGDLIVQTASMPIDRRLRTNMLKVCHVD